MPPNSATVAATAASTDCSLLTSQGTASARPPASVIPSATEWIVPGSRPASSDRAATATDAPASANATATVRPMPRLAPATNATFPFSEVNGARTSLTSAGT